jgi:BirA family biotin operon repressor/biotin-[acetyl-CoA-carboxylase] ligase
MKGSCPLPPDLAAALAAHGERLRQFGERVLYYDEVTSTNDLARHLADRGEGEGVVVIAHAQSAGRGRHGRVWASPPGAGLYFSTVLRPAAAAVPLLTIAAGVAVAEGVQAATGLACDLKWPNDVYVGERKLAGVLAEADARYVVVGIGINVMPAAYPPDVAARATSIEDQLGRPVDRGLLLVECLSGLDRWYTELREGSRGALLDAWRARAASMLGRRVCWQSAGVERMGIATDIDDVGALLVRTADGMERIISGEVRWS